MSFNILYGNLKPHLWETVSDSVRFVRHALEAGGVRYGLVCTEAVAPDGTWNFGAEGDAPGTFAAFELAARNADFVWCLLEESVAACSAMNERTAYLPF